MCLIWVLLWFFPLIGPKIIIENSYSLLNTGANSSKVSWKCYYLYEQVLVPPPANLRASFIYWNVYIYKQCKLLYTYTVIIPLDVWISWIRMLQIKVYVPGVKLYIFIFINHNLDTWKFYYYINCFWFLRLDRFNWNPHHCPIITSNYGSYVSLRWHWRVVRHFSMLQCLLRHYYNPWQNYWNQHSLRRIF